MILANFDRSVRPQDDFYRFVNGAWLEKTQIPPDRSNYGTFLVLQDSVQQSLRAIVESAAADPGKAGSDRQLVGDLFASYMDEAAAERAGPAMLAKEFAAIDAIKDAGALVDYFGRTQRRFVNAPLGMENFGAAAPLAATVNGDAKEPDVNALYVDQFGLGMPDRDYYLESEARYVEIRGKYESYVRDLLTTGRSGWRRRVRQRACLRSRRVSPACSGPRSSCATRSRPTTRTTSRRRRHSRPASTGRGGWRPPASPPRRS